jgi:hypothetical protein
MEKVRFKIVFLGGIKYDIGFKQIKNWKTNFFEIDDQIGRIKLPNSTTEDEKSIYYSDKQLKAIIGEKKSDTLTVVLINQKLEDDYYEIFLDNNIIVLSLYETAEIVLKSHFKLYQFIIQELYSFAATYYRTKGRIYSSSFEPVHHDIRKCLFDFNDNKNDIVYTLGNVSICEECESKFDKSFLPKNFVKKIEKELKRIKKDVYHRMEDFIKNRIIISLIIGTITAILLGVISNYIYDFVLFLFGVTR